MAYGLWCLPVKGGASGVAALPGASGTCGYMLYALLCMETLSTRPRKKSRPAKEPRLWLDLVFRPAFLCGMVDVTVARWH
eukprot:7391902-Prymnesium_polylepis.1